MKVYFLGDGGVGKTCLLRVFQTGEFNPSHMPTLGMDYVRTLYKPETSSGEINVTLWDTAGQDRFRSLIKSVYRETDGIALCFDLTNELSFTHLTNWIDQIREAAPEHVQMILLGNKRDLTSERVISKKEAEELAAANKMEYFETSAVEKHNVKEAINKLLEITYQNVFSKKSNNANTDKDRKSVILDRKTFSEEPQ